MKWFSFPKKQEKENSLVKNTKGGYGGSALNMGTAFIQAPYEVGIIFTNIKTLI